MLARETFKVGKYYRTADGRKVFCSAAGVSEAGASRYFVREVGEEVDAFGAWEVNEFGEDLDSGEPQVVEEWIDMAPVKEVMNRVKEVDVFNISTQLYREEVLKILRSYL